MVIERWLALYRRTERNAQIVQIIGGGAILPLSNKRRINSGLRAPYRETGASSACSPTHGRRPR
jgi:hypothetical protein